MKKGNKQLLVVGDRVLIAPEVGEVRTKVGLILPPGAVEKEDVQGGKVVAMGPGTALPPPTDDFEEPWKNSQGAPRYLPMQVQIDDYAVFFRKAAIEITFQDTRYLVVPQSAILALVRDQEGEVPDTLPEDF